MIWKSENGNEQKRYNNILKNIQKAGQFSFWLALGHFQSL